MKYISNLAAAAFLAFSLSGCIIVDGEYSGWDDDDWRDTQRENREVIAELELTTERKTVLMKLGAPNFSEAFTKGDDQYRVLYYRTQHRHSDGDTTKDETTPLVFKNDKLIGWGEDTLANLHSEAS